MARDSQGIPQKKASSLSGMHNAMTAKRAMPSSMSSRMGGKDDMPPKAMGAEMGGGHSELHDHGDGIFHTVVGGQQTEHPSLHHALTHMAAHHGAGEKHMMVHHMSGSPGATTHHAMSDGKVQGPSEHPDAESLKSHLEQFLNEEGGEGHGMSEGMHDDAEPAMSGSPMY